MDWLQLSLATSPPSLLTLRKAKSRPAVPVSTAPSNPSYDTTSEVGTTGEANKKRSGRLGVGWVTGEIDDVVTMAQWRFFSGIYGAAAAEAEKARQLPGVDFSPPPPFPAPAPNTATPASGWLLLCPLSSRLRVEVEGRLYFFWKLMMRANLSPTREAPPTRAPSMSGHAIRSSCHERRGRKEDERGRGRERLSERSGWLVGWLGRLRRGGATQPIKYGPGSTNPQTLKLPSGFDKYTD